MTRPRFSHSATKGIERERREKVTGVVRGVENGGGNAGGLTRGGADSALLRILAEEPWPDRDSADGRSSLHERHPRVRRSWRFQARSACHNRGRWEQRTEDWPMEHFRFARSLPSRPCACLYGSVQRAGEALKVRPTQISGPESAGRLRPLFSGGVLISTPRVGYAIDTFADGFRDDFWGSSCNGQRPLLKRFA